MRAKVFVCLFVFTWNSLNSLLEQSWWFVPKWKKGTKLSFKRERENSQCGFPVLLKVTLEMESKGILYNAGTEVVLKIGNWVWLFFTFYMCETSKRSKDKT